MIKMAFTGIIHYTFHILETEIVGTGVYRDYTLYYS